jgi:RNA polymerase sigma-70 factor, ECF subfamily
MSASTPADRAVPDESQAYFDALYRAHYGRVLAYALRRSPPEVAHDVVADTFLVAWRRLDRLPANPLPWLLGVARKTLSTHRRSAQRQRSLLSELQAQDAMRLRAEVDLLDERALRVADAFTRLPEQDQEMLRLIVWDGLSSKEAAAVVGVSHVAARVRVHRAKRKLAAELDPDEDLHQPRQPGRLGITEEAK